QLWHVLRSSPLMPTIRSGTTNVSTPAPRRHSKILLANSPGTRDATLRWSQTMRMDVLNRPVPALPRADTRGGAPFIRLPALCSHAPSPRLSAGGCQAQPVPPHLRPLATHKACRAPQVDRRADKQRPQLVLGPPDLAVHPYAVTAHQRR